MSLLRLLVENKSNENAASACSNTRYIIHVSLCQYTWKKQPKFRRSSLSETKFERLSGMSSTNESVREAITRISQLATEGEILLIRKARGRLYILKGK